MERQYTRERLLTTPSELQKKLGSPDLCLIDVRPAEQFAQEHIPGAVHAPYRFWRGAENMAVLPQQDGNIDVWAVSQGTFLRRMHILGPVHLWETTCATAPCTGYSSGGFIADSKIDGQVNSGTQQQFLSRNTDWASWMGANWNMVFVGASNELGEFESGITAALFGTVPAVVIGGLGTLGVVALWMKLFPPLREVDRLTDAARA